MTVTRTRSTRQHSKTNHSPSTTPTSIEPTSIEDCVSSKRLAHNTSYHQFKQTEIDQLQKALLDWFDAEKRTNMPWRKPARSDLDKEALGQRAYEVWVSEIMLQQTQVATVIEYYNRWLAAFPTIYDLATADIEQVNTLWAGLGYYSRAARLKAGAQKVVEEFDGLLPNNAKDLEKHIPGVGPYTAGAIASIVFGQQTALVDGNVIRVLTRLRAIGADMKKADVVALFWQLATTLVPEDRPGDFNQALMELGARVCTPQNPNCDGCPVRSQCIAVSQLDQHGKLMAEGGFWDQKGMSDASSCQLEHECQYCPGIDNDLDHDDYAVTRYPVKVNKKPPRDEECAVCILERLPANKDGDEESLYLISRRPDKGLLAGLWEFPSLELGDSQTTYTQRSKRTITFLKEQYNLDLTISADVERQDLENVVHLFSHIRKVYHIEWVKIPATATTTVDMTSTGQKKWITMDELKKAPIPTGLKKAIKLLEKARGGLSTSTKRKQPPPSDTKDIASFFQKKQK